jgi:DNA polymerase
VNKKQTLLEQIRADIIDNNVCPDLAKTAKNLVMGDGNIDTDIVFIGEAPGKNEDETGLPFVGAAGKFLDEMLATAGMQRSDIYITNIVKYRPPNNRDPLPEEKKAFWPFLVRQLNIIRPKIVVTLGRHSMEYFLPDIKISEIHGQPQRISFRSLGQVSQGDSSSAMQGDDEQQTEVRKRRSEGVAELSTQQRAETVVLVPLYHPAAALYNGGLRATLIEDFMKLPTIINLLEKENK